MREEFGDDLNVYVFTTKSVILGNSPITLISHDKDGDWQFLQRDQELRIEDAMLVSLGEIIDHDPSILEIADLPLGRVATRQDKNSPWQVEESTH